MLTHASLQSRQGHLQVDRRLASALQFSQSGSLRLEAISVNSKAPGGVCSADDTFYLRGCEYLRDLEKL